MKKILSLCLLLSSTLSSCNAQSLANELCDRFFCKLQNTLIQQKFEERPYKITRSFFETSAQNGFGLRQCRPISQQDYSMATLCFHELCSEIEAELSEQEKIRLAQELDLAFTGNVSGYFEQLCGIARPEKICVEGVSQMGRRIYNDFVIILGQEQFLIDVASQKVAPTKNADPKNFIFSANDHVLGNLEDYTEDSFTIGLLHEQQFFIEILENHWSFPHICKFSESIAKIKREKDLKQTECEGLQNKIDEALRHSVNVTNEYAARFAKVSKQPLFYKIGNLMFYVSGTVCVNSIGEALFDSDLGHTCLKKNLVEGGNAAVSFTRSAFRLIPVEGMGILTTETNSTIIQRMLKKRARIVDTTLTKSAEDKTPIEAIASGADKIISAFGPIGTAIVVAKDIFVSMLVAKQDARKKAED